MTRGVRQLWGVPIGLVLVAAILGGCSDKNDAGERPKDAHGQVLTMQDGTMVLVGAPSKEGMSALFQGRVAVIGPGHCLGLHGEDGDGDVVVWPNGTTLTDDGTPAVVIGGEKYALGETVELGGGVVPVAMIKTLTVPEECRVDEVFVAGPRH